MEKISYNNILTALNDPSIYGAGEKAVNKALEVAKSFTDLAFKEPVIFFTYWIGANINEKHKTALKSFLVTQDLSLCKLRIYSDVNLSNHPIIKELPKGPIQPFLFDVEEETEGTPLQNCKWNSLIKTHQLNPALESDYFRLLMLYKYGGVYTDFDILFLRDLRPLMPYEWVYQWGSEIDRMNGAIMRLKKENSIGLKHLNILKDTPPLLNSLCWADKLYQKVRKEHKDLIVFPGAFFNSEWQIPLDGSKFMTKCEDSKKMFEGCFTWHWHNKWNLPFEKDSKFDLLKNKIETLYKERFL